MGFAQGSTRPTSWLEHKSKPVKACNIIRYVMLPGMKHRMLTRTGPLNGLT
jgi:hypothetical protein